MSQFWRARASVLLQETAAVARKGMAGAALVTGVAGTGKTSLLNQARAEFGRHDGTVVFATARPGSPGETMRELFAPLGLTAADVPAQALLPGKAAPAAREAATYWLLRELYRFVVNRMAGLPLTIMLDDAHRCDPFVLRWVDFLLRRATDQPLLVVLAYDPDVAGPRRELLATIAGQNVATTIELGRLSRDEIAGLVAAMLGDRPEPPFLQVCADLSGGNPLMLRTLLTELRAHCVRPDVDGTRRAAEVGQRVLAGMMPMRLRRLPENVRRVAAGIALLGATERRMIAALLELPAPAVTMATDVLRRHGLLPDDRLEFVAEPARAAVLHELPSGELDLLRLRGAVLLHGEGHPPERTARLLVDLPRLAEPWMVDTLREAAVDARTRGEPDTGVRFLNKALRAVPGHPETLIELATMLSDTDPDAAVSHFLSAIERTDDVRARAALVARFGMLTLSVRRPAAAFRALTDVLDALDSDSGQVPAVDELRGRLQAVLLNVGLRGRANVRETLCRASTMRIPGGAEPSDQPAVDTPASAALLANAVMLAGESSAAEHARAALSEPLSVHNGALVLAARVLDYAGLPTEALAALDHILAGTPQLDAAWTRCHALAFRSSVAMRLGRAVEAATDARAAMEIARNEDWALPRIVSACLLLHWGEPRRAASVLDEIGGTDFVGEQQELALARAEVRIALGDTDGALSLLMRCGAAMSEMGIGNPVLAPWWFHATGILVSQDRRSEARALVEAQEEAITRWATPEAVGLGLVARGAATGGRPGLTLMVEGIDLLAASPARLSQLRAELMVGAALARSGDTTQARRYLHRALELAVRCGCRMSGSAAKVFLMAAGGRLGKRWHGRADLLTVAERRVVEQAATGATNREIAAALFVAVRTVETHLSNVYRKLGVASRAEIVPALRELSRMARVIEPMAVAVASAGTSDGELLLFGHK